MAILTIAGIAYFTPRHASSSELSDADIQEIRRIATALADGSLPQLPHWGFKYGASKEGQQELAPLGFPNPSENLEAAVRTVGGWTEYKDSAAALLKSKDPVVRGLMALWVADLGDSAYAPQVWELLRSAPTAEDQPSAENWDRGQAAFALGVLNAQDHADDLVQFLQHESPEIRGGAAQGLSWMNATESIPKIANLLADRDDSVICSAMDALARLKATRYVDQIAEIATNLGIAYQLNHAAMRALVELDAKDQTAELVKLMDEIDAPEIRCHAILSIALLDGQDDAEKVAEYIDDRDVGFNAAMALGIMRQTQYADKLASFLRSDGRVRQQAAAWALILMESPEYARAALGIYESYGGFDVERSGYLRHASEASIRRLNRRFNESVKKLKEAAK